VIVLEGKKKISNQAFGEVLQFLKKVNGAILFDSSQIWMIYCDPCMERNVVESIKSCKWTDSGSKEHLRNFIGQVLSTWANLIIDACTKLELEIEQSGYLGRGAMGRVIKCITRNGEEVALKVVKGEHHCYRLFQEFETYKKLESLECVAKVVSNSPVSLLNGLGSAMCISPVGRPAHGRRPISKVDARRIFQCLEELHSAKVTHGDARIENLILVEDSFKWIDFMDTFFEEFLVKNDWLSIIRSFLKLGSDGHVPLNIERSVDAYLVNKNIDQLLDVVYSSEME
jgi:predicted Ser/Thr protein kinase